MVGRITITAPKCPCPNPLTYDHFWLQDEGEVDQLISK